MCSTKSARNLHIHRVDFRTHTPPYTEHQHSILFSLFPDFIIIFHFRNWVGNGIFTYSHRVFFPPLILSPPFLPCHLRRRAQTAAAANATIIGLQRKAKKI